MNLTKAMATLAGVAVAGSATPLLAHHSYAMFDNRQVKTVEGTVKEMQWTNPHIWIQVVARDPQTGRDTEWSVEGNSPNSLVRQGWSPKSTKAGDKVVVTIHPLKDGSAGGSLVSMIVNGVKIGRDETKS